ncbi:hypothetical protein JCM10908_001397 [Rhodotorula pacifica]|uniref:uncharacterized protein n=1 Tax=Rhodotorula pacifica TaxID=1495444 RepID=UPI00316B46BE
MPLDSALYTLLVRPRTSETGWIDLTVYSSDEAAPTVPSYALYKDDKDGSFSIYDPFTLSRLGTSATAPPSLPNAKTNPKHRLTRLYNPDAEVHIWNQPGLSWSWEMEWEETRYVWTREVASLLSSERGFTLSASRKPDPNFPVLQYHPHRKGGSIEILDHNIARIEPPIRDRKGLEVASLLALCHFIEHLFPASTASTAAPPTINASSKPPELPSSSNQPTKRERETKSPAVPPFSAPPRKPTSPPAPRTSRLHAQPPPPQALPRIDIADFSPKALDAHYRYCLALLQDPALPALVLSCQDPRGNATLEALANRIKQKRLKLSRGADVLDVQVSPNRAQQTEQARGGWFGFLQADPATPAPSANEGISIRLSRAPPASGAGTSSQPRPPLDKLSSSSNDSRSSKRQQAPAAAPPLRRVSPKPPAPLPRPAKPQKHVAEGRATNGKKPATSSTPSEIAGDAQGSGWLSMFGRRGKE